jgi:hypothetical protein
MIDVPLYPIDDHLIIIYELEDVYLFLTFFFLSTNIWTIKGAKNTS